jgi:hypothetical protein
MKSVILFSVLSFNFQTHADSLLNLQWSLKNSGSAQVVDLDPVRNYRVSGKLGEDVRLPQVAPLSPRQVLVAVLDTGIDRNHPDLKNVIREKPQECAALAQYIQCLQSEDLKSCDKKWMDLKNPEVDTDKNGYPMDCYGWSAIGAQSEVTQVVGSPFFIDNIGHGTHVAGIIGAETGNSFGIRGVSPYIKLLPVQVIDDRVNEPLKPMSTPNLDPGEKIRFEQGYKLVQEVSDRVARGFLYALNEGAEVISMSLGWPEVADSKLLRELIKEANRRGVLVVAAAGNDSTRALLRPCVYEGVICVGSLNPDGSLSHFSNYGSGVDIAAPGLSILSTYPEDMRPVRFRSNLGFEYLSGTSQATPLVAGAVADLLSRGIPSNEIYARLIHSARPLKASTALFQVFATGESQTFEADSEPLKKYILSGQLDIQKALETPFRVLIIAPQRSRPEILWDGKSSRLEFDLEMINRGAAIKSEEVSIQAKIRSIPGGAVRPQVIGISPVSKSNSVWKQNETRFFKVQLKMPADHVQEIPADLDLEIIAKFSNGFEQLSVVEPEVLQTLASVDSTRKKEMLVKGLPLGQWDWTPLESRDGSQRGEVYLLTEQEGQGFRVATARIVNNQMEIKGPVTLPGTRGLKLVAVMWGAWTGEGTVFGVIEDPSSSDNENSEQVAPLYLFDLDQNLNVRHKLRYDSKFAQLPFQTRWVKVSEGVYRPAWIGAGLDPNKKPRLSEIWQNRNERETPEQRLYWLDEKFKVQALSDYKDKKFVDFVPGPGDAAGVLTAMAVRSQGPRSQPDYIQDVAFVTFTEGKVTQYLENRKPLFRSLLEARRGSLFNLDSQEPSARGLFWFSEGSLRTQKITTWDSLTQKFDDFDAKALRLHFDSALWTQAVYSGQKRTGAFTVTNSEIQYHDLSTQKTVRKSLDRYSFFSDSLQIMLAYPLVIEAENLSTKYRPALFATENIDFERGVKLVVPIFANDGGVVELVSPGTLNIKAGTGCKPFKTPIQLNTGETALDFFCEKQIQPVQVNSKDLAPGERPRPNPIQVEQKLIRVYLKY